MYIKYWIDSVNAVVGVNQPMIALPSYVQSKKGDKDQKSIQSSTTPDQGYHNIKENIKEKLAYSHICRIVKNFMFCTQFINAYVPFVYIVYVKHWINSSKTVVGVHRHYLCI